jgi:hypothetical protein
MRVADPALFMQMVVADLQWFVAALSLCGNVKAAIMAGSVTGKHYMDEFLQRYLPAPYSIRLRSILEDRRRGATSLYVLAGPEINIPVFFCSTSPSGDRGVRLGAELERNLTELKAVGF